MRQTILFKTGLAVLCGLMLTATGLWAGGGTEDQPAVAADKKYVTDPTTGKVVSAPEYGGTITIVKSIIGENIDPYFSYSAGGFVSGVNPKFQRHFLINVLQQMSYVLFGVQSVSMY